MKALSLTLRCLEHLHAHAIETGETPVIFGEEVALDELSADLEAFEEMVLERGNAGKPGRKPKLTTMTILQIWDRKPRARSRTRAFREAVVRTSVDTRVSEDVIRRIWRGAMYRPVVARYRGEAVSA